MVLLRAGLADAVRQERGGCGVHPRWPQGRAGEGHDGRAKFQASKQFLVETAKVSANMASHQPDNKDASIVSDRREEGYCL
jgi:hypothetical protein